MSQKQIAKPTVSVCLPVFNGEPYISKSIEAVLSQSFNDFELLIADDGSTDGSASVIQHHAERDTRIVHWQNKARLGLFANYNACIEAASGTYIKLFAQDDLWAPQLLERQVELFELYPEVALVSCEKTLIDGNGTEFYNNFHSVADILGETFLYPAHQVIKACLNHHWDNLIGEPSTVMFRNIYRGSGFNTMFRHAGDLEYWLRILHNGDLAMVNEPLVFFRRHQAAATATNTSQLWAYTDVIHLAFAATDALAQIGLTPSNFIAENLRSLAPQIPRLASGDVDIAGIIENDEYNANDVAALKKSFLHALSLIPPAAPVIADFAPCAISEPVKDTYPEILENERRIEIAEHLLRKILGSESWRATKPLRELNKLVLGAPSLNIAFNSPTLEPMTQLEQQANYLNYLKLQRQQLIRSRSWKYTKRFRKRSRTNAHRGGKLEGEREHEKVINNYGAIVSTDVDAAARDDVAGVAINIENLNSPLLLKESPSPSLIIESVPDTIRYDFVIAVHEASRTGAPLLALSFAKCLKERGWKSLIVLQEGGEIADEFKDNFDVIELAGMGNKTGALDERLKLLRELGAIKKNTPAFLNSAVVNGLADSFKRHKFLVISLIHEILSNFSYIERARLLTNSDISIFSSNLTLQNAKDSCNYLGETHLIPQGLLDSKFASMSHLSGREFLVKELGIPQDAFVVLSCGTADQRKGIDLFPFLARQVLVNVPSAAEIHFVWIGGIHTITYDSFWWAQGDVNKLGIKNRVHFVGAQIDIEPYFVGADMFLLCSREDPMPCVLHQAHAAKLPIVAFDGSGGATEFLANGGGKVVPYGGIVEMASAILHYFHNKDLRITDGAIGHQNVISNWQMDHYVDKLLALARR